MLRDLPFVRAIARAALTLLLAVGSVAAMAGSAMDVKTEGGFLISLKGPKTHRGMEYITPGKRLGDVHLRYRAAGEDWCEATNAGPGLFVNSRFEARGGALIWTITLRNPTSKTLEVGDLSLPLPIQTDFSRHGSDKTSVLKHSFISGSGSFLFWMRPDSAKPFLTMTALGDTSLEYWEAEGGYRVYLHAKHALEALKGEGTWRQPGTSLFLTPSGSAGDSHTYGFKFQWADGYEGVRNILVNEGHVDTQVVPGMTLPSDLTATVALRSKVPIQALEAEFPADTVIQELDERKDGTRLFQVRFARLGENRLLVRYGNGRHIYLEFFSTEPVETLIKKRGSFIARHQHQDPTKWYRGLLAEWNMENHTLLGPDNYDQIKGWRIYEVTCDDPGLSKPAFLATKLAEYPVQSEVDALDEYLQHFVWGGLQQTDAEPFPYGVYGIPDWKQNRESPDPGPKGRQHLWRVYDYPHIVATYLGMYRVARHHPEIHTALSAEVYLRRAYGTALAMFTVPMAIAQWSPYETGYYNEIVIPHLMDCLKGEGLKAESQALAQHWDKKAQFFVNDQPDLFGSEYPFDSTGFESTHALATYALKAPTIRRARAKAFLERQLKANLFCRGWIEPAYYLLGSDYRGSGGDAFTLSYMSPMGGGAILDYGLNHAEKPAPFLRLGYASILSAWALMNTGTPESGFGYWFPGQDNDGGVGGGFEPAAKGRTWLEQPHHRGPWFYSSESDLGFCGALRNASTILTDDPLFGRICYGGTWKPMAGFLEVAPKDGVRRRFHALLGNRKLHLHLTRDRFAGSNPIQVKEDLSSIRFHLESDTPGSHNIELGFAGEPGQYRIENPDGTTALLKLGAGNETPVTLPVGPGLSGPYIITRLPSNQGRTKKSRS
ncbi:DUF5695 domain-containing protein [Geothrix sp. PMB-07]|uniref:DUF5695 domain-containing protein n=1 Tax=Geothrix sp. PMB-07 TaxID=3068640 RepID=UPI002741579C|nr:DUF5695 domain-containing protein [Geothrix sp. PMB-07]WLT30959.1 DUF5695 domain-containing protein [Geothrix sp. PMB-07]